MTLRAARRLEGLDRTLIRRIFDAASPSAINLGLGQPDLPTPPPIALAGIAAVVQGRSGYTATAGDPDLRNAVAAAYGSSTGIDDVLITAGAQEGLFAACLTLLDPGDEVLVPDPGYPAYPTVARLAGAIPVAYRPRPETGFRPDCATIAEALTPRTRLVLLNFPANPTGACFSPGELERTIALLADRGVPWLSDEVYSTFAYGERPRSAGEVAPGRGLVVSGLSKAASMTGWRLGWIVGPRRIVDRIAVVHQHLVTCAPHLSQRAALAAFTPEGRVALASYRDLLRHRRTVMAEALEEVPRVRFRLPDGAFYFFVDVSSHGDDVNLAHRILSEGDVVTVPGQAFGPAGRGYLRLSFAAGEQDIRRGVRAIRRILGG